MLTFLGVVLLTRHDFYSGEPCHHAVQLCRDMVGHHYVSEPSITVEIVIALVNVRHVRWC